MGLRSALELHAKLFPSHFLPPKSEFNKSLRSLAKMSNANIEKEARGEIREDVEVVDDITIVATTNSIAIIDNSEPAEAVNVGSIWEDREREYDEALGREELKKGQNHSAIVLHLTSFPESDGWTVLGRGSKPGTNYANFGFKNNKFATNKLMSALQQKNVVGLKHAHHIRAELYPGAIPAASIRFRAQAQAIQ